MYGDQPVRHPLTFYVFVYIHINTTYTYSHYIHVCDGSLLLAPAQSNEMLQRASTFFFNSIYCFTLYAISA